jgi:hypothetical protein
MDLERRLREALRAEDPGPAFTARVAAQLAAGSSTQAAARPAASRPGLRRWRLPASFAATLLIVSVTALHFEQRREQLRVAAAQSQLLLALDITSRRLEAVHHSLETRFSEDSP